MRTSKRFGSTSTRSNQPRWLEWCNIYIYLSIIQIWHGLTPPCASSEGLPTLCGERTYNGHIAKERMLWKDDCNIMKCDRLSGAERRVPTSPNLSAFLSSMRLCTDKKKAERCEVMITQPVTWSDPITSTLTPMGFHAVVRIPRFFQTIRLQWNSWKRQI